MSQTIIAQNRKARHDYFILETIEAGLMLTGSEVKSLRLGQASIGESYASPDDGALWLVNASIQPYANAGPHLQHEERRPRRLLVKKKELARLIGAAQKDGVTLIPLKLYFTERGIAKLELGLAKGKKKHDKRETEKKRDWQRDKARIMRERG